MQHAIEFSEHAITRMAQRGLTEAAIHYVLEHGQRLYRAGALHCFLGKRDIPADDRHDDDLCRLEGTTVLLDPKNKCCVITVYRNREALKNIRSKRKRNLKRSPTRPPLFGVPPLPLVG